MNDRTKAEGELPVRAERSFATVVSDLKIELAGMSFLDVVDLQKGVESFLSRNSRTLNLVQKNILAQIRNYAEVVRDFKAAKTLGDEARFSEAIDTSVDFQQRLAQMVAANTEIDSSGFRFYNSVDEVFVLLFDMAKRLGDSGLVSKWEGGYIDGCRGMVGACLLMMACGWKIEMPDPSWDRNYDIDLIGVSPDGKKYGVDVTSSGDKTRGEDLAPVYLNRAKKVPVRTLLAGVISVRIPQVSDERFPGYFERGIKQKTLGIPSKETVEKTKAILRELT